MSLLCCCVQGCALLGGATTSAAWWPQSGWQVGGAPIVRGRAEECRKVGQGHAGAWGGLHHLQARVVHNLHTLTTPHLYCHVASPGGATDTAWQCFLPIGPLAVLPVQDGLANIVWSTTPDMAAQLGRMGPQEFVQAVNKVCMRGHGLRGQHSDMTLHGLYAAEGKSMGCNVETWVKNCELRVGGECEGILVYSIRRLCQIHHHAQ